MVNILYSQFEELKKKWKPLNGQYKTYRPMGQNLVQET